MNNIQIKQFNDRLNKLYKFVELQKTKYSEKEIIGWIAECTDIFYEIGVDSAIISHFLDYFNPKTIKVEIDRNTNYLNRDDFYMVGIIGPFKEEVVSDYKTGNYILIGNFYYVEIAFSSARNMLKNKIEEERIVPFWLLEQISKCDGIRHLATSLELIENKYEKQDGYGLITESITLLDSILNLDYELKSKNKLGRKLNSLIENEDKRKGFGVSKDIIIGLNCERILRNEKVVHKNVPLKYEVPFMIATSFAYLVIFFVELSILHGKIISYE